MTSPKLRQYFTIPNYDKVYNIRWTIAITFSSCSLRATSCKLTGKSWTRSGSSVIGSESDQTLGWVCCQLTFGMGGLADIA